MEAEFVALVTRKTVDQVRRARAPEYFICMPEVFKSETQTPQQEVTLENCAGTRGRKTKHVGWPATLLSDDTSSHAWAAHI